MAVGLELTLHQTEEALRLSGLGYDSNDSVDCAYMYILSAFHGCSIAVRCQVISQSTVQERIVLHDQYASHAFTPSLLQCAHFYCKAEMLQKCPSAIIVLYTTHHK